MAFNGLTLIFESRKASTAALKADILDENGHTVPASELTTLKLTLKRGLAVLNNRDKQDVLNTNGVTVNEDGRMIWTMDPRDNPVLDGVPDGSFEVHKATFLWTWAGGGKQGQIDITINCYQNVDVANA